jgi:hypothetical protein
MPQTKLTRLTEDAKRIISEISGSGSSQKDIDKALEEISDSVSRAFLASGIVKQVMQEAAKRLKPD